MIEVPTRPELYELAKTSALLRSSKLTEASFSPGYMLDVHAGLASALAEEVLRFGLELNRKTFFSTAQGDDLDALAADHFGIARQEGTKAIGEVTFTRANTAAGNISIPVGTRVSTSDGTLFLTTEDILVTGLSLNSTVEAVEVGEQGIVDVGTIVVILDALGDSFSVTNAQRTAGGIEKETDDAFRVRIAGFLSTVRRGTPAALEFGATQVAGVLRATVDESSLPPTVYIADAAGGANDTLVAAVQDELVNWRAAGVQVNVQGATQILQDITLALTFRAGFDTSSTRDKAIEAVVAAVNSLGIGETLFRSAIVAAAKITGIRDVVVSNPAGDVAPSLNQLIRTEKERVTLA